jgi:hypothetical protein
MEHLEKRIIYQFHPKSYRLQFNKYLVFGEVVLWAKREYRVIVGRENGE